MSSNTNAQRSPFRVFTHPTVQDGSQIALGRTHASWYLIFASPNGTSMDRAFMCVNFIDPSDPTTVGVVSPHGRPRFSIGGTLREDIIKNLLFLRDAEGRPLVKMVKQPYHPSYKRGVRMAADVLVPESELAHACARCGRWETQLGPRFLRCGGCKDRYYCSKECQKDDWTRAYHKGECKLLQKGKAYEVERRRKLHDNGWWFENSTLGTTRLLEGAGGDAYGRALDEGDYLSIAYGKPTLPHDVPLIARTPSALASTNQDGDQNDLPPGFVSTGHADTDRYLIEMYRFKNSNPPAEVLDVLRVSHNTPSEPVRRLTMEDLPVIPPLPSYPGFTPTGDPTLDEVLLSKHLRRSGTVAQRRELRSLLVEREKALQKRRRLAAQVFPDSELRKDDEAHIAGMSDVGRLDAAVYLSDSDSASSMDSLATVPDSSDEADFYEDESEEGQEDWDERDEGLE
ncbi:hypothetical protein C8Q76DRAFT_804038 [Earliella scabrosa]|nr:hypothetical protein C8Q76DRAFT_804038 [Earliella scabrosa]